VTYAAFVALLKGLPWRLIGLVLFGLAVAAAVLYGAHRLKEAGRDEVRAEWQASIDRGRAEIAELDRQNAAREAEAKAEGIAIGESRARDQRDNLAAKDRLITDLRTGNQRLHDRWQACLSGPQAGDAAAPAGRPDGSDELRREIAGQISEADDADSKVKRLQEFVQVRQKLCEAQ
jgi:hypothetical protein